MRKFVLSAAFLLLSGISTAQVGASVKPHGLFTDGMVLQQGAKTPVWGTATPGEKVTVKIQGQQVSAAAGKDGTWMVHLKDLKPGGPFEMHISGGYTIVLKDVLVGEVWVCSGQSNMEWSLAATYNAKEKIKKANYPMIRLFKAPKTPQPKPIDDFVAPAKWMECSPGNGAQLFGRRLLLRPRSAASADRTGRPDPVRMGRDRGGAWTKSEVFADEGLKGLKGSDLYNGMIAPLLPFAIKGVIWYQGESNADKAWQYRTLFPAMIKSWRDDWKQGDFPFLFVQLAPWDVPKTPTWAELREAQLYTAQTVKNTAQVVITDFGDPKDIHPQHKEPVGAGLRWQLAPLLMARRSLTPGRNTRARRSRGTRSSSPSSTLTRDW